MKPIFPAIIIAIAAVLLPMSADSKPAKPGVLVMTQPDGTQLHVRLHGDEHFHCYFSVDGYPLVETKNGFFFGRTDASGNLVSTGVRAVELELRNDATRRMLSDINLQEISEILARKATQVPRRTWTRDARRLKSSPRAGAATEGYKKGPGLFPGAAFPAIGEQKVIAILVEYSDVKFELKNPRDYFSRMLNEPGFSDYGGTGSAKEYFEECSGGLFRPDFDVYGPLTLSRNMAFYGGNYSGNDANPGMMVVEACQQLDATVDFSQYDRDEDGFIDNVFLFYAGRGEATGGSEDTVWPHSWGITTAYPTKEYIFDGVQLDRYACSNEWEETRPDGVGTFVHEFSHVLGLPDLYTTAYTTAFTPGSWSALDYGPYNNDGMTPPLYGAFERYALGWIEPAAISGPLNATLAPIGANTAGIIRTDSEYEFFLLENRQKTSWDTYIPGHGMLVWHVDYNLAVWRDNCVNNSLKHQYVDIEEADNLPTTSTRDGDSFPGYDGITSFTDDTKPSMRTWNGKGLGLPLTDIAESADGMITFKVSGGSAESILPTVALEASDVTDESFTARWEAVAGAAGYMLSVYTRDEEDGTVNYLPGYRLRQVGNVTAYTVDGLDADAEYYFTVYNSRGLEYSEPSNEISVYTGAPTIGRLTVVSTGAVEITETGFTATWDALPDAIDYQINVYTKDYDAELHDRCDFTDGVNPLPKGWQSSSTSSFANDSYSGTSKPSLRLSDGDHITASFADGVRSVSFWHRGSSTSDTDFINVYAVASASRTLEAALPVVKEKGGKVCLVEGFPEGTVAVRIEYERTGTSGSLAIDDIDVGHGRTTAPVVLEGYTDLPTGGASTSYTVNGLESDTEYFYTVRATDGIRLSRASKETAVRTQSASGIVDCEVSQTEVTTNGRRVGVSAAEEATTVICDMLGRVVACGTGSFETDMPASGIYVVSTTGKVQKIIVE